MQTNLLSLLEQAEDALNDGNISQLFNFTQEIRRLNVANISAQSELAAKLHQRGEEFSPELQELAKETLDTYQDLEDMVKELVQFVESKDTGEVHELLEELKECHLDLEDILPRLESQLTQEEGSQFQIDEEHYLS